ncbi:hypothetical protein KEM60_00019 [Austwickia sp. TVS 96-490-7B]|uniref:hypothetical protein n=1 Tax=Austwickia sp. TVS 96-490-7B TaxID=2830843 RepID=UPI001C5A21E8|nr:hypothetical protein [Austwickia sp. TVS 96-490-7B]MBW3083841.1 hypothetical protein [Austwickia sp. TVS 96-490-7B]
MSQNIRTHVPGRARVEAAVPRGWLQDHATDPGMSADLVLWGPRGRRGRRPRLTVEIQDSDVDLTSTAGGVARSHDQRHPGSVIVSTDVWPHPVWGDGLLLQTARVDGDHALAHDYYVFLDGPHTVCIDLECPLADLLGIEDEVADIVSHIRPKVA